MSNKILNFVFLISLFLLQSCSGGKIGDFLESSFKNNSIQTYQKDNSINNLNSSKTQIKKNKVTIDNKDQKSQSLIMSDSKEINKTVSKENNLEKLARKNKNFNPKSYRIYVILKKVDPSFPTENFSKVLRNADINFEIEKIEIIPEQNQDFQVNKKNF
tara:strand:+ start:51 stop:527 length:477 start_codon:yes stop_codon:yes gene_type:complete